MCAFGGLLHAQRTLTQHFGLLWESRTSLIPIRTMFRATCHRVSPQGGILEGGTRDFYLKRCARSAQAIITWVAAQQFSGQLASLGGPEGAFDERIDFAHIRMARAIQFC